MSARRAVSLVELSIAFLVLSLAVVPLVGLFTGGRSQAAMSEHQIYAELATYRVQEDHATRHFGWLYRDLQAGDVFPTLVNIDKGDGERNGWWAKLTEFQRNAWKAQGPLKGTVKHEHAYDGKGLHVIMSSATWTDMANSTKNREYTYHLLRLRAKRDYGLRANDARLDSN
jgi:hypothetical protein